MSEPVGAELRALLSRAAQAEAQRQSAIQRGDPAARDAAERELQRLHHQYVALEATARNRGNAA